MQLRSKATQLSLAEVVALGDPIQSTIQPCVDGDVATPRIFHGAALV